MPEKRMKGLVRGLIYPIQFSEDPASDVDRVLDLVVRSKAMNAEPAEYLEAVQAALRSDERLAGLIPQGHPESVIRTYLSEIKKRLEG